MNKHNNEIVLSSHIMMKWYTETKLASCYQKVYSHWHKSSFFMGGVSL